MGQGVVEKSLRKIETRYKGRERQTERGRERELEIDR